MQVVIAELAEKHKIVPGQVLAALHELGVEPDGAQLDIDEETLELIEEALKDRRDSKSISLSEKPFVRDLAAGLGVSEKEIIKYLNQELKANVTQGRPLSDELAEQVAEKFGYTVEWQKSVSKPAPVQVAAPTTGERTRPPIVTILGHVDHGKTSLLDYIRKTNVVAKEHGGITQHIGAYQVVRPDGTITFIDTPGHAAFTAMRARGAQVTDIAILVVAADDGIMPQTKEAISHALNAEVPIIVAINKIDVAGANPDRIMQKLPEHNLVPEAYGGDVIVVPVSAMTGEGIDHLLEMILLQAEVLDLKADPDGELEGVVIEAQLEKGRGPVATVLIENGTLEQGDIVVVGATFGKVKAMTDYKGERQKAALPAMPVEILGLDEVPQAGDKLERVDHERDARYIVDARKSIRDSEMQGGRKSMSLRQLQAQLKHTDVKDLNLIIKADVQGSVEAVRGMIDKVGHEEVEVKIIHSGVGSITESDILLASASNAICIGFNVKPEGKAKKQADSIGIEIRTYSIIYELIEDIEAAMKGMLEPKFEEEHLGTVEIRMVFKLTKIGKVAGCHVTEGKVKRDSRVRVRRENELVYEGKIESLRNVKEDVREMFAGQDCGIRFVDWVDYKEGDVIEAFEMVQVG